MKYLYFGFMVFLLLIPVACTTMPASGELDLHIEVTDEDESDEV